MIPNESLAMSELHRFDGAVVRRIIDPSRAVVAEHAHDWPVLSLYVMGDYRNATERGEHAISGPSFVLYRRGAAHRNAIGERGFEQIEIEFDPAWLGRMPDQPVVMRIGGMCGALAHALAAACTTGLSAELLRRDARRLLIAARDETQHRNHAWVEKVDAALRADPRRRIGELAGDVGVSPAWIGPAYRRCSGESLKDTAARLRVERAAHLLRESDRTLADIAMDAGFCDQSHMNRAFRRVLARAPAAIRRERIGFRHTT